MLCPHHCHHTVPVATLAGVRFAVGTRALTVALASSVTAAAPAVAGPREERMGKHHGDASGAVSRVSQGSAGEAHHSDFGRVLGPRPFSAKGKVAR